jgi:NAD(P)-dependent dehydrogenase (short-subunit alcohol dehydrogenase family)
MGPTVHDTSQETVGDPFRESVTVITGAGSGIGRALAVGLARRGALVVPTDVNLAEAQRTAQLIEEAGHAAWPLRLDVTESDGFTEARDFCLEQWGRVDRIVNNVGIVHVGLPGHLPLAAWQRCIDVNLLGIVRSNEVFLPVLIEQGFGQLVNTASTSGLFPYSFDRLAYTASKAAVVALTEALALYLRPQGIKVSCICPAGVRTGMTARITHYGPPRPLGVAPLPVVDPDEFAETILRGLAEDRFLICSVPEAYAGVAARGADVDGYLAGAVQRHGFNPEDQ